MTPDDYSPARPWWKCLSKNEARDPMGAIYDVQLQIDKMKYQLEKDQKKLNEHHSRLAFLRDVARRRLGEPKIECTDPTS